MEDRHVFNHFEWSSRKEPALHAVSDARTEQSLLKDMRRRHIGNVAVIFIHWLVPKPQVHSPYAPKHHLVRDLNSFRIFRGSRSVTEHKRIIS